jgi:hypothetical protein
LENGRDGKEHMNLKTLMEGGGKGGEVGRRRFDAEWVVWEVSYFLESWRSESVEKRGYRIR